MRILTPTSQAEMLFKQKPKLPAQFKSAEQNGVPYAVILGESELANGQVRLKEMGLPYVFPRLLCVLEELDPSSPTYRDGHPEKDGTLVRIDELVGQVRQHISRTKHLEEVMERMTRQAGGLKIVGGIKSADVEEEDVKADQDTEDPASKLPPPG